MWLLGQAVPVEYRASKGVRRIGIGDALARRRIAERGEAREFPAPPLPDLIGQLVMEIAEEREGIRRGPFLAHEKKRRTGGEQHHRDGGFPGTILARRADPRSEERRVGDK